jgi:hypothetical protein
MERGLRTMWNEVSLNFLSDAIVNDVKVLFLMINKIMKE